MVAMNRRRFYSLAAALCVLASTAKGQDPTATALPGQHATGAVTGVQDGIAIHKGRPYLLRNGHAWLIDVTLVPEGQLLTDDGLLVPLPAGITGLIQEASPPGPLPDQPRGREGPRRSPYRRRRLRIRRRTSPGLQGPRPGSRERSTATPPVPLPEQTRAVDPGPGNAAHALHCSQRS